MDEVERMTFAEYIYRFKAYNLQRVDKEYDFHLQAWLNVQAGATKMKGEKQVSVYKGFKDFFDYEKRINEIEKPKVKKVSRRNRKLAQLAAKANS